LEEEKRWELEKKTAEDLLVVYVFVVEEEYKGA
jgi:hypothetical protein